MSVLQIDKKAVTEADGQRLIDQTCGLRTPLGTPTEFVRPEEFKGREINVKNPYLYLLVSSINNFFAGLRAIKKTLSYLSKGGYGRKHPASEVLFVKVSDEILNKACDPRKKYLVNSLCIREKQFEKHAHTYSPDTYKEPKSNLIKMFSPDASSKVLMEHALEIPCLKYSLPGLNAQWQFFTTWHEIGKRLRRKAGVEAFKARDFEALECAALEVCKDEDFGKEEQQILKRFALACRRFSVGEYAYTHEEGFVPEELLDSELGEALTFKPGGYVPD